MNIEYKISHQVHQCTICLSWSGYCRFFRILENHESSYYRTLETFKCLICDNCFNKGNKAVQNEIDKYMKEYYGTKA